MSTSLFSSTITAVSNRLKPHRAEALHRIRLNGLRLITTLIVSYLLPVPSWLTAARTFLKSSHHQRWSTEWLYEWICVLEMVMILIFAFNILEATWAVRFPRAPLPQITSPAAKSKSGVATSPTPKRAFKVLSPNSSPQPQKSFGFSPSSSLNSPSILFSSSTNSPAYSQSPTTPSPVSTYRGRLTTDVGRALDGSYLTRLASESDDTSFED